MTANTKSFLTKPTMKRYPFNYVIWKVTIVSANLKFIYLHWFYLYWREQLVKDDDNSVFLIVSFRQTF